MSTIKNSPRVYAVAGLLALIVTPAAVSAASQCKGVQQDACQAKVECSWVEGYVRKDGLSVSSHCKSKARRKPADQAALGRAKTGQVN